MTIREWLVRFATWQYDHSEARDVPTVVDEFLAGRICDASRDDSTFRQVAADRLAAGVDLWVHRGIIDARSLLSDLRLDYGKPLSEQDAEALVNTRRGY